MFQAPLIFPKAAMVDLFFVLEEQQSLEDEGILINVHGQTNYGNQTQQWNNTQTNQSWNHSKTPFQKRPNVSRKLLTHQSYFNKFK